MVWPHTGVNLPLALKSTVDSCPSGFVGFEAALLQLLLLLLSTTKLTEKIDILLALFRCRFQKLDTLVEVLPLIQKLGLVVVKQGLVEFGEDDSFDGLDSNASLGLFLDSAF